MEVKAGGEEGGRGTGKDGRWRRHFLLQGPLCQCTRPRGLHQKSRIWPQWDKTPPLTPKPTGVRKFTEVNCVTEHKEALPC